MERRNICNNINRNTSNIFNHIKSRVVRNNLVTPEIFVSEIWMQEDSRNGVEIIELNSSNSEVEESSQEPSHNFSQAWSFVNNDRFREAEDYRINEIARERRRNKNEEEFVAYANEYLHDQSSADTQTNFNGFRYIDDSEISGIPHSEQMNCFTIINNHVVDSDSSSDNDYPRVEEIQPYFSGDNSNNKYWDHVYKDDIITYDSTESIDVEKRTVWIYSFKNKRRLSENDFELLHIPSKDSTDTSTSPISDEEHKIGKGSNVCRIASPIPATFIPRLDLSLAQTLSTVTEISEVKNSKESSKESLVVKPVNNWLTERHIQKPKTKVSSVVNWMALSPRERRRRFKNTNSERDHEKQAEREIFTFAEGNTKYEQPKEKSRKSASSVIQVDVEVHANDIPDAKSDTEIVSVERFELEPKVEKKKVDHTLSINISYADADTEIDESEDINFGPYTKPSIQLTSDKTCNIITEPIEKLNSSQWIIGDENIEEQIDEVDYVLGDKENIRNESVPSVDACDSASKRLWVKNTKLMKSPIWAEYLPITVSPNSLHLSLSLSSLEDKKSWFKRIAKYFNCCK